MKVAVVGLGVEGKQALHSLLNNGHQVYASDMNKNLKIEYDQNDDHEFELELGSHDWDKINSADAVVLSPSLWNNGIFKKLKSSDKLLSDVLTQHRDLFTIGVTGTNGKTTTCFMIKEILENSGYNLLLGGNAGGGFEGYTEIILEASKKDYDFLIVEVCDMTLNFCSYNFDFDLIVVTNLGCDHLNVHQSLQNYQKSMQKFLKDKKAVLNINDKSLSSMEDYTKETFFFDHYPGELKLFGKFNRQNAAAAVKVAEILKIPSKTINKTLKTFDAVDGRITELKMDNTRIIIGKTDNISATTAVFQEVNFDVILMGTPRSNEHWRYDIFKEVSHANPCLVGLFPGLDDTTLQAKKILINIGYQGPVIVLDNVNQAVEFTLKCKEKYSSIFIGGNGQDKIKEIKENLEKKIC